MTDIPSVLPRFSTAPFLHLIPSLDKASVSTGELVASDPTDVARKAQLPPSEVKRLTDALLVALQEDVKEQPLPEWKTISLLDSNIDDALGGGIPLGYLTEVTGESGAGKTQFLLTLLLSIQAPPPLGLGKSAIYISTEAALATSRLSQMLRTHPQLNQLPGDDDARTREFLGRILTLQTPDLESQEHILRYQVPVAIQTHNIGLVVIDSIAANYRAEFENPNSTGGVDSPARRAIAPAMAERKTQLFQLGAYLRELARKENIAIVVSNQVADRFEVFSSTPYPLTDESGIVTSEPLTLDHQQRWFTGWGDLRFDSSQLALKTPSLGLVWTNQITARIALIKDSTVNVKKRRRWMRVVFASWVCQSDGRGIEYEITAEGIRAVGPQEGGALATPG